MGSQNLLKGLIIGLIIGLVTGFGGGFLYKDLSATTPLVTSEPFIPVSPNALVNFESIGPEEDVSGNFGNELMAQIGAALVDSIKALGSGDVDRGLAKLTGEEEASTLRLDVSDAAAAFLEKLLPKANAQGEIIREAERMIKGVTSKKTRQCTDEEVNAQSENLNNWFNNYVTSEIFKDNICIESAKLEGKVWMMIHEKETPTGKQTFIEFKFEGELIVTYWVKPNPNDPCEQKTLAVAVPKQGGILITRKVGEPDRIEFLPGTTPPQGSKKICQKGGIPISLTIRNPKFDKNKCCESVSGLE